MIKEITAKEARNIAFDCVPAALLEEILTKIKEVAIEGKLRIVIDISSYYDDIWYNNLELDPSIHLLKAKLKTLGYFCEVSPPSPKENPYPDMLLWIEIEW